MDELVRNFRYDEKPKVSEYYPQYYHKTDKVKLILLFFSFSEELDLFLMLKSIASGWPASIFRAARRN